MKRLAEEHTNGYFCYFFFVSSPMEFLFSLVFVVAVGSLDVFLDEFVFSCFFFGILEKFLIKFNYFSIYVNQRQLFVWKNGKNYLT